MDDDSPSPPRFYTLEHARALLPAIRSILLQLAVERRRQRDAGARLAAGQPDGRRPASGGRRPELERSDEVIAALLEHLDSLGVQLRDVDAGLVDIPTLREGEPAWFCWRLEDGELAFWHTTREGFASRRPL